MRTIKATSLLFLILVVPSLFSQPSNPSPDAAQQSMSPEFLLQRAHAMLPTLSPMDRMEVLSQLANSSSKKHREDAAAWLDEAWTMASHSDRTTRLKYQTVLLMAFSNLDSAAALDRLAMIEPPPHPGPDDWRLEAAAEWTFGPFYHDHPDELERIVTAARHLGDIGNYPFGGASNVVSELVVHNFNAQNPPSRERREAAQILIQDAIRYFGESAPSDHENEEFTNFLRTDGRHVPPELLKPTLRKLVARLDQPPRPPVDKLITMIPMRDGSPAIVDRNRNEVLLAELMPLIRTVDPAWEQELRMNPMVNRIAEALENHSALMITGGYAIHQSEEAVLHQLRTDAVRQLAFSEPKTAAKALSGPVENATTVALQALADKDSHPEEAAVALSGLAQQAIAEAKTPRDRMLILSNLARSLATMRQPEQLAAALDQSFGVADAIISAGSSNYLDLDTAGGYLAAIVQIAASVIPEHTLIRINEVHEPALQAKLLIAMVRGLDSDEFQPKPAITTKAARAAR
jgi:hypothetical protein